MAATIAARISNTIRIGGTLIRRSLLLHDFRELIEVLLDQPDVVLELNGLCVLERDLKLRQVLFLLRLRQEFVGLKRGDLLLNLFWWLGEPLSLLVDAGHDHRNIH